MTRRLVVGIALLAAHSAVASAQGTICGDFLVNSSTAGVQRDPAVAAAPNGGFVVVWEYEGFSGIFGRSFDGSGTPQGPDFPVSAVGGSDPALAMDAAGNFVAVWTTGSVLSGRLFDQAGVPQGPEFVVATGPPFLQVPAVARNPAGDFVVTWATVEGSVGTVRARRYDAAGVPQGSEFQVHPDLTSSQFDASVAFQGTGPFVVVWQDYGATRGVSGRRFDGSGVPLGGVFQVSDSAALESHPRVAAGPGGDFVVAWVRLSPGTKMAGRAFDAAGNPNGPEFHVSTAQAGIEVGTSIAGDPLHGYVVAWQDQITEGVVGQRLDPAGVPVGPNFVLNRAPVSGILSFPEVARRADGRSVAVWDSDDGSFSGIFGRIDCPTRFRAITPCRVVDTRVPPGSPLFANSAFPFPVAGTCGIPSDARAVALNVTAVNPTDLGNLRVYPGRTSAPLASFLNFVAGRTRAGHAIVPMGTDGQVTIQCDMPTESRGTTHVVLDVYGYFEG